MEGEVQMMQIVKRDFGIKAISVFFAILLWFIVLNNYDNPFEKKNLDVAVNVLNPTTLIDKKLGFNGQIQQSYVQVEVRGRKDKTDNISASDIEASVDLSQIKEAGANELQVTVYCKKAGVDVSIVKPKTINFTVEKIIQKSIPVSITQTGKMKENYKITKITPSEETVMVEGVESLVNQAVTARTVIDINNINKSLTLKKDIKVYGKNDEELAELGKNGSIEVTVDIAKEVSVVPTIKGKPANDYIITGYTTNKDRVLVSGFPEQLDSISELTTEAVSVENISKNSDIVSFIKVPEGLKLVDTQKDITVSVKVEKLNTMNLQVNKAQIELQNKDETKFTYEIIPDVFNFTIKGRDQDIKNLTASNFKIYADLTGFSEGTFKIPVKIIMPNNDVNRVDDNNIEIKISKK
jgi:Uncharacterized protein conserved in bacteria